MHPAPCSCPHTRVKSQSQSGSWGAGWGGEQSAKGQYLNERGGGLGSGDRGSVGEAGRQRRLLCQEKRFSRIRACWELRHNLREKGEVRRVRPSPGGSASSPALPGGG